MKKVFNSLLILTSLLLVSCATKVNYDVIRPAELDLNGANTISILPFLPSNHANLILRPPRPGEKKDIFDFFFSYMETRSEENEVIDFINSELKSNLYNSKYLNLIDSKEVEYALKNGNVDEVVDVYLTGEILKFDIFDEKVIRNKTVELKDEPIPEGGPNGPDNHNGPKNGTKIEPTSKTKIISEENFKRNVYLNYIYEIIDAKTNEVISYKQNEIKKSSSEYGSPKNLPGPFYLIKSSLESDVNEILKDIQPYSVNRSITLLDNKAEKNSMEKGKNLVKIGNIESAYNYYYDIYEKSNLIEAGYNAALLLEVQGKYDEAEDLMTDVYLNSEDKKIKRKAKSALEDIRKEKLYDDKLKGQILDQQNRAKEDY